jgi:hypothetical protein
MKKSTYVFLLLITVPLLAYTVFYSFSHPLTTTIDPLLSLTQEEAPATATTTEKTEATPGKILTTHTGKIITVNETNPNGSSLSTITITPSGFSTNTPLILETNKLQNFFLVDLNSDTFDELIIVTQAQGSGSYGEVEIYTTTNDTELAPVTIQAITEEDTHKGGLFEGYMGHDIFTTASGTLLREFPMYTATDTNSVPTGPHTKILYTLTINKERPFVTLSKEKKILPSDTVKSTAATTSLQKK